MHVNVRIGHAGRLLKLALHSFIAAIERRIATHDIEVVEGKAS
jgi:hypothetical protein